MALNAQKVQGTGQRAPALEPDNYMARLVQVVDMGVQAQRPWQGQEKPPVQEIMLTYELTTEFMTDDDGEPDESRPRWLSERIPLHNLKADKAKSTKRYMALDPKMVHKGDFAALIGKGCLVAIVNNERDGKVYNNIGGITPPLKGIPIPDLVNPPLVFDQDEPDLEAFYSFPDWIQNIMKDALSFPASPLEALLNGGGKAKKVAPKEEEPDVEEDEDDDFPV